VKELSDFLSIPSISSLSEHVDDVRRAAEWVEAFLEDENCVREGKWTQNIAIGSEGFVEKTRQELGIRARSRKVVEAGPAYQLREPQVSYSAHFGLENNDIGAENAYFWNVY
jgi:putative transposase